MFSKSASAALSALLLISAAQHLAAAQFASTVIDANGPAKAWGKAAGDLNGDGKTDVLVGSRTGGLYWYENPTWIKRTISATAVVEEDMEVVDLDQDGRMDVVAVGLKNLTWFRNGLNNSNGQTVWTATVLVSGTNLHDVEVLDFDGDGKLDLVARNQGSTGNLLYFWRQVSLTEWTPTVTTIPIGGEGLAHADFDRDGRPDLAIGEYWYRNMSSPGTIGVWRYLYSRGAAEQSYVATGDINGDGRIDIVTSPAEPNDQFHRTLWFEAPINPTSGTWKLHEIEPAVEKVTHFVGVTDYDLDGDLDVATALTHQGNTPRIKLFENLDGEGTFSAPQIIAELSSHSMKFVRVGNDVGESLFGADYNDVTRTPIRLFRWTAD